MRIFIAALVIVTLVIGSATLWFLDKAYVLPVLMYHAVDENEGSSKLSVAPDNFEAQMKFLHEHKYNVVGLDKVVDYMMKKEEIPPKTVAITFDDGFYNNYKYAYPVLKKYGIPATIFVITSKVGAEGYAGWDDIRQMSDSGIITIGSHTKSHKWLPSFDDKVLMEELVDSKKDIEEKIGRRVDFLCYPVGAHDERVKRLTKESGYRCAVATNPGKSKPSNDIYAIKRIRISRTSRSLLTFWIETSGYYTWIKEHRDTD